MLVVKLKDGQGCRNTKTGTSLKKDAKWLGPEKKPMDFLEISSFVAFYKSTLQKLA